MPPAAHHHEHLAAGATHAHGQPAGSSVLSGGVIQRLAVAASAAALLWAAVGWALL